MLPDPHQLATEGGELVGIWEGLTKLGSRQTSWQGTSAQKR